MPSKRSCHWKFFKININLCEFSEVFKSKLFQISQSPVRFDFFPVKYRLMLTTGLNPQMVPFGALCKTIASKVAFYIGKLTDL